MPSIKVLVIRSGVETIVEPWDVTVTLTGDDNVESTCTIERSDISLLLVKMFNFTRSCDGTSYNSRVVTWRT